MLITRECDYAMRVIRALSSGEITSIQAICEQEQITPAMAYKIARKLEKSGFLKSFRGNTGGYSLNCSLEDVTLYDIFKIIDSKLLLIECMNPTHSCALNTGQYPCQVHKELCRIQNKLNQTLQENSLAKILKG